MIFNFFFILLSTLTLKKKRAHIFTPRRTGVFWSEDRKEGEDHRLAGLAFQVGWGRLWEVWADTDLKLCTRACFLRTFQVSTRPCQRRWPSSSCCSVASIRLTNSWAMALRLPRRAWFMTCGTGGQALHEVGALQGQNKAQLETDRGRLQRGQVRCRQRAWGPVGLSRAVAASEGH